MAKLLPFPGFGGQTPEIQTSSPEDLGVAFHIRMPKVDFLANDTVRIANLAHGAAEQQHMQMPSTQPQTAAEQPVIKRENIERTAAEAGALAAVAAEKEDDRLAAIRDKVNALAEGGSNGILSA